MTDLEGLTKSARVSNARTTRSLGRRLARAGLGVWFIVMLSVGASLLARHVVALPRPTIDPALVTAMASLRTEKDSGRWMVVHVLYAECRCSQRIAEHLLDAPRPEDTTEEVLLVGHDADLEARLAARSFRVLSLRPEELGERFHIVAVPSFLVTAPDGSIRYAGGYTARKQGPDPRDRAIVQDLRMGKDVEPLPIFGCAVGEKLERQLNPLGLP